MNKNGINFMYLYRTCQSLNIDIPSYMEDLDLDNLNEKNFLDLLNIFIEYFNVSKKDNKLICTEIDEQILNESENLNMNKYGVSIARAISSVKFFIDNLSELYLKYNSRDFISNIDDVIELENKYKDNILKIKSIKHKEETSNIKEDNDSLIDILF